ncbi:MAG TPA: hypothetical protein VGC72_16605 [Candidatus Elarobacter sp.]|jgi:hypothetical protein
MISRAEFLTQSDVGDACRITDRLGAVSLATFAAHLRPDRIAIEIVEMLVSLGLAAHVSETVSTTRELRRSLLLLDAVEGGDLDACFAALRSMYPALDKISIVRQQMTRTFLKLLFEERSLGRVSICSPWIHLSPNEQKRLKWLAGETLAAGEQISMVVVTRPVTGNPISAAPLQASLDFLRSIGAEIILRKNVHAKVYIRIPGDGGGAEFAVIGSENLTVPKYLELGLLVKNDSSLINKLVGAFYDIAGRGL